MVFKLFVALVTLGFPCATSIKLSSGCGKSFDGTKGSTYSDSIESGGINRSFTVFVPESYDDSIPIPLVVSIHGMGGTSLEDACDSGTTAVAKNTSAFIVVHPQGLDDIDTVKKPASYTSWHFNGTCQNGGVSCDTSKKLDQYCYISNTDCQDCDWTTCYDDVGFFGELFDYIEDEFCIDTDRMYATGQSNGAMMTYQLGAAYSNRLAAIAPISGSLHWDQLVVPESPIPVFAVTGTKDTTVPGNGTKKGKTSDGTWWYYSMDKLADLWSSAQECDGLSSQYETMYDGVDDLWCKTTCSNIDHVLCSWDGNHNYFSGPKMHYIYDCIPENLNETYYMNGFLVWEFFSKHSKANQAEMAV